MLILAKAGLALMGTFAVATVYTFHEGVIRVDVDENRPGGEHIHFWVPATAVDAGMHVVPRRHLEHAMSQAREALPILRAVAKELPKYPNAVFVDVTNGAEHVRIATVNGKIHIDATEPDQVVHVAVPIATIRDVVDNLETASPGV